jgi:4'-phosphopantetheinyl transferase EntD
VGRHPHYRGVGIDIETIGRVDSKLWPTLFTDSEINYFTSVEPALRDAETTVFFSAKEAFYKCQYPMTQQWVGFHDVELQRVDSATLSIKPAKRDAQVWHQPPIHSFQVDAAHIVTLMLIPA